MAPTTISTQSMTPLRWDYLNDTLYWEGRQVPSSLARAAIELRRAGASELEVVKYVGAHMWPAHITEASNANPSAKTPKTPKTPTPATHRKELLCLL